MSYTQVSALLTKYEYTNILGIRAKQINEGAKPFVNMDKEIWMVI